MPERFERVSHQVCATWLHPIFANECEVCVSYERLQIMKWDFSNKDAYAISIAQPDHKIFRDEFDLISFVKYLFVEHVLLQQIVTKFWSFNAFLRSWATTSANCVYLGWNVTSFVNASVFVYEAHYTLSGIIIISATLYCESFLRLSMHKALPLQSKRTSVCSVEF